MCVLSVFLVRVPCAAQVMDLWAVCMFNHSCLGAINAYRVHKVPYEACTYPYVKIEAAAVTEQETTRPHTSFTLIPRLSPDHTTRHNHQLDITFSAIYQSLAASVRGLHEDW